MNRFVVVNAVLSATLIIENTTIQSVWEAVYFGDTGRKFRKHKKHKRDFSRSSLQSSLFPPIRDKKCF